MARQLTSLFALTVTLFLTACSNQHKIDEQIIKAMEENLSRSNNTIDVSTETILKSLEDKTTEWRTKERSEIWLAKTNKLIDLTKDIYNSIETLKHEQNLQDTSLSQLYKKTLDYNNKILAVDSEMCNSVTNKNNRINTAFHLLGIDTLKGFSYNSNSISLLERTAVLTLLQNYLKVYENKLVTYCHQQGGTYWSDDFESYSALVGQNSTYLKPGGILEITAGIGNFNFSPNTRVTINGKPLKLADQGFADFKTKVSEMPGKYYIPVIISFLNEVTNKKETKQVNVEYTVAAPCDQ